MRDNIHLFAGTYALGNDNGIHIYRFDQTSGRSEIVGKAEVDSPSYFAFSRDGKYLFAVLENDEIPSSVNVFSYNNGKEALHQIDSILSGDDGACYITIDKDGKRVLTANYGGGSISVFDIDENGQFYKMSQLIVFEGHGIHPDRQTKPHIHCVEFSPDGRYLFAADLGTDKIYQMEIDYECIKCKEEFVLHKDTKSIKVPDGSGPRHILFHPSGKYLYLINELSDTIIVFAYNDGELSQIQEIPIVTNGAGGSADIVITPDGQYLYASVRLKDDGVAIFKINPSDGLLHKIGYQLTGIHPRNLRITPNGKYLLAACRDSGCIEVYQISKEDGLLENIHKDISMVEPACLKFI